MGNITITKDNSTKKHDGLQIKLQDKVYEIITLNAYVRFDNPSFTEYIRNPNYVRIHKDEGIIQIDLNTPSLYTYDYITKPEFFHKSSSKEFDVIIPSESWAQSFQIQNPRNTRTQVLTLIKSNQKPTESSVDFKNNKIYLLGKLKYLRKGFTLGPPLNEYLSFKHTDDLYHVIYEGLHDHAASFIYLDQNKLFCTINVTDYFQNFNAYFDDVKIYQNKSEQKAFWVQELIPPVLTTLYCKKNYPFQQPPYEKINGIVQKENLKLYSVNDKSQEKLKERINTYEQLHEKCTTTYTHPYTLKPITYKNTIILLQNTYSSLLNKPYIYLN